LLHIVLETVMLSFQLGRIGWLALLGLSALDMNLADD